MHSHSIVVFIVTQPVWPHLPEHLVQATFKKGGRFHIEIPEVVKSEELRGKLDNVLLFLLFKGRQVDMGEKESLHITHLAQERSKHGQGRQMPGAINLHFLDTVQLHPTQDFLNVFHGHCNDLQLLTAQVYGTFSLLHPPDKVDEEFIQVTFLEAKFYIHLQQS